MLPLPTIESWQCDQAKSEEGWYKTQKVGDVLSQISKKGYQYQNLHSSPTTPLVQLVGGL